MASDGIRQLPLRPLQCRGTFEALGRLDAVAKRRLPASLILKPDLLAKLRLRALTTRRPMAGCGRAARLRRGWLANSTSPPRSPPQRGWEALKAIRLVDPGKATFEEPGNRPRPKKRRHVKEARECRCRGGRQSTRANRSRSSPRTRASRIGLKPITRRVGAPLGERSDPAHGHHRFDWPLCHGICITGHRRAPSGMCFQRRVEGILRRLCSKPLRARPKRA